MDSSIRKQKSRKRKAENSRIQQFRKEKKRCTEITRQNILQNIVKFREFPKNINSKQKTNDK